MCILQIGFYVSVGCAKEHGVCAKCCCRVDRIVGRFVFHIWWNMKDSPIQFVCKIKFCAKWTFVSISWPKYSYQEKMNLLWNLRKDEPLLIWNFISFRDVSEVEAEQKMLEEVSFCFTSPFPSTFFALFCTFWILNLFASS